MQIEVLIIDDEPEFLEWVTEFLESYNCVCEIAENLPKALATLASRRFQLVIIDMNVPANEALSADELKRRPLSKRYPGLAIAAWCRNQGYSARQLFAYTVHDDDALDAELVKLICPYVLKGRPYEFKRIVRFSLGLPATP